MNEVLGRLHVNKDLLVWVWHLGDFSYIAVIDWWVGAFVWEHEGLVCRLLAHLPHDFYYLSSLVWQETQLRYRASPDLMFQNHCSIGGFVNFSAPYWCLTRFCLPLVFLVSVYATGQWVNTSSEIIAVSSLCQSLMLVWFLFFPLQGSCLYLIFASAYSERFKFFELSRINFSNTNFRALRNSCVGLWTLASLFCFFSNDMKRSEPAVNWSYWVSSL